MNEQTKAKCPTELDYREEKKVSRTAPGQAIPGPPGTLSSIRIAMKSTEESSA
jgi:hypothetical protein